MTDEKVLRKIDKMLKLYGVSAEQRAMFLKDIQEARDEEEDVNPNPTSEPTEELPPVEEKPTEGSPTEEVPPVEENPVGEEPTGEPNDDIPTEEPSDVPTTQYISKEEYDKAIQGYEARLSSLESTVQKLTDIVEKQGETVNDEGVGLSPTNTGSDSVSVSEFDKFNAMRTGKR